MAGFPNDPLPNATHTIGLVTWRYDGVKWSVVTGSVGIVGPKGEIGATGATGLTGDIGATGPVTSGSTFIGVRFTNDIVPPEVKNNGDLWLDTNSGILYLYLIELDTDGDVDSEQWIEVMGIVSRN